MIISVSLIVVANAAVSQWLARRGRSWESTARQFGAMLAVNAVIVLVYVVFFRQGDIDERAALFFLFLLTLLVTLYDRYRPLRAAGYPPIEHAPT